MSELSKNQLTTENNNSFPNNNTGYITPTLLRTFNQNMIDSLVDEQTYTTDSGSFNARINALDPSGSAQALLALEQATASLNAYTQSQNSFNSSATASIVSLQNFSSSLDATFATDAQLSASVSALSSSVTVTTNGLSSSIGALQQFSSSLDTTFATDAQLSASASTLQNNINAKLDSASFNSYTQSQTTISQSFDSRIDNLESWSSSLDTEYVTQTELSASASTLQNNINAKLDSASFNTYTQSNDSKVNSLIAATGSYAISSSVASALDTKADENLFNAFTQSTTNNINQINSVVSASATTGSNTFIGNQIISGNLNIAGNITAESASFLYLKTIFETASIIFSSGSNQLGDELSDVQTLSGSVRVQGDLTVNGVHVQTESFDASGYLLTSSFNQYTESQVTISQSFDSRINGIVVTPFLSQSTFNAYTQSNNAVVNSLVAATASYANSASVASVTSDLSSSIGSLSASAAAIDNSQQFQINSLINATSSYVLNSQTASMTVLSASYSETASYALNVTPTDVSPFLSASVFNAYTESNDTKVNALISQTGSYAISSSVASALNSLSASVDLTYATKTELSASASTLQNGINSKVENSTFNTYTQSQAAVNQGLTAAIQTRLTTASFNSYTSSNDSKVNSLIAATGSYITSAQTSSMSVLSSSFAVTASFAENVTPTDVSMFVSQSTFNAYTQSNDSVVNALVSATSSYAISSSVAAIDAAQDGQINSLIAATSSYITESETGSFAKVDVANVFTQNQTISGNLDVTGKITALSASITYLETIFETASVIFSSGSNQFGDEAIDVQTLYGSVRVMNTLTASGLNYPTADNGEKSFLQTDGNGNLSLQYVDTIFEAFYAVESVPKGTPLYFSGSQGANPRAFAADASNPAKMPVVVIANDNLTAGNTYEGIVLGLIEGIDLSGFTAGQTVYVAEGGGYSTSLPSGSNSITQVLGIVTKGGSGGKGLVLNPGPAQLPGLQTGYVWVGNNTNQPVAVATSSIQTDVSGYTTTASFNSYTQSNDSKVNALISATGSYATTASNTFIGNQIISGNLLVTGSNINLEVDAPALSIGTTNVKTIADTTASGVVSSLDVTRLGAGPTGDLSAVRIQTLSGSDTSGDTLLSRVTTGVNRHTSTGMTGSVVNTQMVSTWATGSAGTRVAYSTQIVANAQSQSATLTLAAGNLSSNNAGGTASIAAGLIRIGTNASHTISTTGSFGPIVIVGPLNQPAFSLRSGSFEVTTPQGSGSFYTNLPITSSAGRINGDLIVTNNITASVISASTYIGIPVDSFATTGSNTFKDTQTINLSATSSTTAIAIIGNATEVVTDMYVDGGNYDTFNVQVSANNGVKLRDFNGVDVTPFLSVDTNGGNVRIPRNTNISGSLNVSSSLVGDDGNIIRGGLTIVGDNLGNGLGIKSGSFALTTPQGQGFFYSNLPITSSGLRINGTALVADLIVSGVFGGNSSVNVIGAITASVISASQYVGIPIVNTGSLATTGSNTFKDTQYIISGAISGTFVDNAGSIYTQSNAVRHIVNLGSSSYASIGVPDANTLYVITGDEQYVLNSQTASFATTGSNRFNGNQTITGSLTLSSSAAIELNVIGNTLLTGSVQGNVSAITIASTTASIDCNLGNFFTLTLANGTNHISASNIRPGQTINVRVTTVSGNAVTCSSAIKQPSGSLYTPTNGSGTDILTLVAYDNTTLFMASVKNMI